MEANEARARQVALLRAVVAPVAADHREALRLRLVVRREARAARGEPQQVLSIELCMRDSLVDMIIEDIVM